MTIKAITLAPLSYLYLMGVKLRHWMFDHSIVKSEQFDIPVICVGNITVGGTGKSPMSELLIEQLSTTHNVALLSRGYGRKSHGYVEVCSTDNYLMVGDEPLQMKRKFRDAVVVVCEKRVEGVRRIIESHPDVDVIVMDDGFQHRHIKPLVNIIMVDANRPINRDMPLPSGSLRDTTDSLRRADIFVVTKCPADMSEEQMQEIEQSLICRPEQSIYFASIETLAPRPTFETGEVEFDPHNKVIALAGIANPKPFLDMLHSRYDVAEELIYPDHHVYSTEDLEAIEKVIANNHRSVIITTEKDSVKFLSNKELTPLVRERLHYTPIRMKFIRGVREELIERIENIIQKSKE